jgi:hypothetical protein
MLPHGHRRVLVSNTVAFWLQTVMLGRLGQIEQKRRQADRGLHAKAQRKQEGKGSLRESKKHEKSFGNVTGGSHFLGGVTWLGHHT